MTDAPTLVQAHCIQHQLQGRTAALCCCHCAKSLVMFTVLCTPTKCCCCLCATCWHCLQTYATNKSCFEVCCYCVCCTYSPCMWTFGFKQVSAFTIAVSAIAQQCYSMLLLMCHTLALRANTCHQNSWFEVCCCCVCCTLSLGGHLASRKHWPLLCCVCALTDCHGCALRSYCWHAPLRKALPFLCL